METIRSDRFLSLDVLRGIAVACMILVNNQYTGAAFMQLRQGTWNDITFTDMVFPFFIFIVGASFWFFSNKEEGVSGISMVKKVFFRGIKLFVAGLLLNWCLFGLDVGHLRIFGVLQRIAVVYVLGAFVILGLKKDWKIVMAVVFILLSYWGILAFTGGYASIENYIGTKIDRAILGCAHMYQGYGVPFEPEGILSTYPAVATMLLGYLTGMSMSDNRELLLRVKSLFWSGFGCVIMGLMLDSFLPLNKAVWSSSYVLYSAGWAMMVWTLLSYIVDIEGRIKWTFVFNVFGTNAIFAYLLSCLIAPLLYNLVLGGAAISEYATDAMGEILPERTVTFFWSFIVVLLCWGITYLFYRKRIFIKL